MANIADLQVSLNLDTSKFKADILAATKDVTALKTALSGLRSKKFKIDLQTNIKSQLSGFKRAEGDIKSLQRHLSGLQSSIKSTTGTKTLKLTVNSNAEKVMNDMKTLNANSKLLSSTLRGSSGAMGTYNNSMKGVLSSVRGVSAAIKTLTKDVNTLNAALGKSNTQLKQMGTKTIKINATSNVPQIANSAAQTIYKMTSTFTDAEGKVRKTFTGIGSSIQEAESKINGMAKSVGGLTQTGSKLQTSFKDASGKITGTMNEATKAVKKTTAQTKLLQGALVNVKSVAQGIIIAQTFYNAVGAVQEMASSMFEMHKSVELNMMAFENLAGSTERAAEMVEYLQKYAASTTFTFEQASQSAKTLLAYGFKLENISYVMKTIGDATSAMGKPENFDRIGLALGQMLAKGTAKAEELRQLMEAGIPVVEILTKKLGLTADQVVNIGDEGISSVTVVNALLEEMGDRYGGLSEKMAQTTTGLMNNIKESIAYVGSQLFKPLYDGFAGVLKPIAEKLTELSTVIRNAGIDGALKYLFPPEMVNSIKVFCGLVMQLGSSLVELWRAISPVGREFAYTFINVFNVASPIVIGFLNVLAKMISVVTANRAVLQALIGTFIGFMVVNTISRMIRDFSIGLGVMANIANFAKKAMVLLNGAIALLIANPIVAAIAAISAAFIALVMSTERGRAAVDKLWVSLARLMGIKNVDIYKPLDPKDLQDDLDNFFEDLNSNITGTEDGLGDVGDGMGDVGDEAGDAGKKVKDKFVASFDELFQVPEKLDEIGNAMGGIGDIELGNGDDPGKETIDTGAFDIGPIIIPIDLVWGPVPKPPDIDPPPVEPIDIKVTTSGAAAAKAELEALMLQVRGIPTNIKIQVGIVAQGVGEALSSISLACKGILTDINIAVGVTATNVIDTLSSIRTHAIGIPTKIGIQIGIVSNKVAETLADIKEKANAIPKLIETKVVIVANNVISTLQSIKEKANEVPKLIETKVSVIATGVTSIIDNIKSSIATIPRKVTTTLGLVSSSFSTGLTNAITMANTFKTNVSNKFNEIKSDTTKKFTEIGNEIPKGMSPGFSSSLTGLGTFVSSFSKSVGTFAKDTVDEFTRFAQSKQVAMAAKDADILMDAVGFEMQYSKVVGMENSPVLGNISNFKTNMTTAFKQSDDVIINNANVLTGNFRKSVDDMVDTVTPLFQQVDDAKVVGLTGSNSNVISLASKFTKDVSTTVDDLVSNVVPLFGEFDNVQTTGLTGGHSTILSNMSTFASNGVTKLKDFVGNAKTQFDDFGRSMVSKFQASGVDTNKVMNVAYTGLQALGAAFTGAEIIQQDTHVAKLQKIANDHSLEMNDIWSMYYDDQTKLTELGLLDEYNAMDLSFGDRMKLLLQYHGDTFKESTQHYGDWISMQGEKLGVMLTNTKDKFTEMKNTVSEKMTEAKDKAKDKLNEMSTNFADKWTEVKNKTTEKYTEIKSEIESKLETAKNSAKTKADAIKNNIVTTWNTIKSDTSTKWNNIKSDMETKLSNMATAASTKSTAIKNNINTAWNNVKSISSSTWSSVKSTIDSNLNTMVSKAKSIVSPFVGAFNSVKDGVTRAMNSMFSVVNNIIGKISSMVSNMVSSVSKAVSNAANAIGGIFGKSIDIDVNRPETPQGPSPMRTPVSPLANVDIPQLYNGGVMTREQVIGRVGKSIPQSMNELGSLQSSMQSVATQNNSGPSNSNGGGNMSNATDDRPILYVGTLIADDRSLKELERKMEVIRMKETGRRGK